MTRNTNYSSNYWVYDTQNVKETEHLLKYLEDRMLTINDTERVTTNL